MTGPSERRLVTIVGIGDSTTAGTPAFQSPVEAPPQGAGDPESQYAHWLIQAQPGWRVLNRGVNGQRSDEIRARFDRDALAVRPDVIVLIAGVNDIYQGRDAASVQRELRAMYDAARASGTPIVAGTILPYNTASADHNARMRAVNEWIREQASLDGNVVFCDTRAAVADVAHPDRLADSPDGLHPSARGYGRMAAALEPAILFALTRARSLR